MIIIKRHQNGKYYDISNSCYTSIHEIKEEIQAGSNVRILKGIEDITSEILFRMVCAQLKTKSTKELTSLIRKLHDHKN